ncbi:restriction endonuclease [Streptomyces sp. NRRL F-5193]|uniref:restriction endonuclease n=1 Tax=Streptomyces sp. NRRL F-5193 TaxID=1463860 RepID=UPI00099CCB22|nr:restriction endonuclease [Streptomyces sp. NRRL F-5193]
MESTTASEWDLKPGDEVERKQLHIVFGGRTQGGIGPSAKTANVFLFTDPIAGEKHGYYDGWMPDGCFHYTGEGQYGDQRMISGNASILNHRTEHRALRVFQGARGFVTYLGEFEVAPENPWYEADAPETGGGPLRRVIVFRLRPVDISAQPPETTLARLLGSTKEQVEQLPVEQQITERTFVNPNREPYEAERKEAALVLAFRDYLRGKGHRVSRQQILPPGETRPLFTDLYDEDLSLLVEGKGSVTRENVRMAIGQLADYDRFISASKKAILFPSEPRSDLIRLAHSQNCVVIWPVATEFASSDLMFPL